MPVDLFGKFPPLPGEFLIGALCVRITHLLGAAFAILRQGAILIRLEFRHARPSVPGFWAQRCGDRKVPVGRSVQRPRYSVLPNSQPGAA